MMLIASISFAQDDTKMSGTSLSIKMENEEWSEPIPLVPAVNIYLSNTRLLILSKETQGYTFTSEVEESVIDNANVIGAYATDLNDDACYIRIILRASGQWQIYVDYADLSVCYNVVFKE